MSPRQSKEEDEGEGEKFENMENIDESRRRSTGWPAKDRKWCGVASFSVTATRAGARQALDAAELLSGKGAEGTFDKLPPANAAMI